MNAAIEDLHDQSSWSCKSSIAAFVRHRPDRLEGTPSCSAASCVDVSVGCYRTLGRVDAMLFLSVAVSCFVFGVGSLCRAKASNHH